MEQWLVQQVWPNLFASLIWAAPAFVVNHLLLRRHITRTVAAQAPAEPEPTEVHQ